MLTNGPLLIFFSSFFFACMSILAKQVNASMPIMEIFFIRSAFGILVVFCLTAAGINEFRSGNTKLLIARGIIGGLAGFLYFFSLSMTTVGMATMLNYSFPIFVTLFSITFLKEKAGLDSIIALVVAFAGVFILVSPGYSGMNPGNLLGCASAVMAGWAVLTMRELRKTDSSYMIFLSFSTASMIYSLPFAIRDFRAPGVNDLLFLVLMCAFSALGQITFTYSLKFTKAAIGSIVSMSTAVFAAAIGRIALQEFFTTRFIIGSILVMGSGIYLVWRYSAPAEPGSDL